MRHPWCGPHRLWILTLLILPWVCSCLPILGDEPTDFSEHIVWKSDDPARVEFVPAGLLQEEERLDIGLHPADLDKIELGLARLRSEIEKEGEVFCGDNVERGLSVKPFGNRTYVDLLRGRLTVLGRVVDIVPGLAFEGGSQPVSTLVYVRIESILSCRPHSEFRPVAVDSVVAIRLLRGDFEIDGIRFCNRTELGLKMPAVGATVIATGDPEEGDPHYMGTGLMFLVEDGQILPQFYPSLGERTPAPLGSILENLNDSTPVCRGRGRQ